jgi:hypothetical protein
VRFSENFRIFQIFFSKFSEVATIVNILRAIERLVSGADRLPEMNCPAEVVAVCRRPLGFHW